MLLDLKEEEVPFSCHQKFGIDDTCWFLYTHLKIMLANNNPLSEFCLQLLSKNDVLHNLPYEILWLFTELHSLKDSLVILLRGLSNKDIYL